MAEIVDLQDEIAENQSNKTLQRKRRGSKRGPWVCPNIIVCEKKKQTSNKQVVQTQTNTHTQRSGWGIGSDELVRLKFYKVVPSGSFWLLVIIEVHQSSTQLTLVSQFSNVEWSNKQSDEREGVCKRACISACVLFIKHAQASLCALHCSQDLRWHECLVSFLSAAARDCSPPSTHGRQSDCFATACLHTVGLVPSHQQPQALSQLITLPQRFLTDYACHKSPHRPPTNYWLNALTLIMKRHKSPCSKKTGNVI